MIAVAPRDFASGPRPPSRWKLGPEELSWTPSPGVVAEKKPFSGAGGAGLEPGRNRIFSDRGYRIDQDRPPARINSARPAGAPGAVQVTLPPSRCTYLACFRTVPPRRPIHRASAPEPGSTSERWGMVAKPQGGSPPTLNGDRAWASDCGMESGTSAFLLAPKVPEESTKQVSQGQA